MTRILPYARETSRSVDRLLSPMKIAVAPRPRPYRSFAAPRQCKRPDDIPSRGFSPVFSQQEQQDFRLFSWRTHSRANIQSISRSHAARISSGTIWSILSLAHSLTRSFLVSLPLTLPVHLYLPFPCSPLAPSLSLSLIPPSSLRLLAQSFVIYDARLGTCSRISQTERFARVSPCGWKIQRINPRVCKRDAILSIG